MRYTFLFLRTNFRGERKRIQSPIFLQWFGTFYKFRSSINSDASAFCILQKKREGLLSKRGASVQDCSHRHRQCVSSLFFDDIETGDSEVRHHLSEKVAANVCSIVRSTFMDASVHSETRV